MDIIGVAFTSACEDPTASVFCRTNIVADDHLAAAWGDGSWRRRASSFISGAPWGAWLWLLYAHWTLWLWHQLPFQPPVQWWQPGATSELPPSFTPFACCIIVNIIFLLLADIFSGSVRVGKTSSELDLLRLGVEMYVQTVCTYYLHWYVHKLQRCSFSHMMQAAALAAQGGSSRGGEYPERLGQPDCQVLDIVYDITLRGNCLLRRLSPFFLIL